MLDVRGLTVRYGAQTVVENVNFSVRAGDWLMVVGPNGAGKSTVLSALSQGVPYAGQITVNGHDARRMKPRERARWLGTLSQNHFVNYAFTVEEVVHLGRYAHAGALSGGTETDAAAVEDALRMTGMLPCRHHSVLTLSGGELQRAFLAQVFAQQPRLLLLDEPANHLDLVYQKGIFGLIHDWLTQPDRAAVSVVHDLSLALRYGNRALLLNSGHVAADGPVRQALSADALAGVYGMDVYGWMREQLAQWQEMENAENGSATVAP